jgi:hypothetical protein
VAEILPVVGLFITLFVLGATNPHMRGQSWNPFGK